MKTAKFGGTSLADAARFRQVKRIVSADPELRFVVVSAPGKRSAEDKKVTDLLYDCHAAVKTGADPETAFAPVAVRFRQIETDLRSGASAAYCASRGEYLSGRMLAALLGWPFLDPAELHFFDADGVPQYKLAEQALMHRLRDMERAVMPGFYGGGADGRIHTLPRGGSDISGALLASASGSDAYENWTDVPGIFRADPAIVPSARAIPAMAYDEVRELAYMGANVLHEDAVTPARHSHSHPLHDAAGRARHPRLLAEPSLRLSRHGNRGAQGLLLHTGGEGKYEQRRRLLPQDPLGARNARDPL